VKSMATGNDFGQAAGGDHRRPAPERAALCHFAQYHESEKKPLETLKPDALGVDVSPRSPPSRWKSRQAQGRVKVPDAKTLVEKLRNEAKVI